MVGSIGSVGGAVNNAAMESFFPLLRRNVFTGAVGSPSNNSDRDLDLGSSAPNTHAAGRTAWDV